MVDEAKFYLYHVAWHVMCLCCAICRSVAFVILCLWREWRQIDIESVLLSLRQFASSFTYALLPDCAHTRGTKYACMAVEHSVRAYTKCYLHVYTYVIWRNKRGAPNTSSTAGPKGHCDHYEKNLTRRSVKDSMSCVGQKKLFI